MGSECQGERERERERERMVMGIKPACLGVWAGVGGLSMLIAQAVYDHGCKKEGGGLAYQHGVLTVLRTTQHETWTSITLF